VLGSWTYETGIEIAEILGSGSNYSCVFKTKDIKKVMEESKQCGRNYLIRTMYKDKKIIRQIYDFDKNEWID
jgi:hypothetical protein